MDSVFGVLCKDCVLIATDSFAITSIFKLKENEDKIVQMDDNKLLGLAGEAPERAQFGDFIQKNIHLQKYKTGNKLTVKETANWMRAEQAYYLRKEPFFVNSLLGGYDEDGPALYWLDYLASAQQVTRGAHGYASYFVSSILDNMWKKDMTEAEGIELIKYCTVELNKRFLISQSKFIVKKVSKEGITTLSL